MIKIIIISGPHPQRSRARNPHDAEQKILRRDRPRSIFQETEDNR